MNGILLSFDIEEFDIPEEYGSRVTEKEKLEISRSGTLRILEVFDRKRVPATFFVTGRFAAEYPDLIRRMTDSGHEIASHGMRHSGFAVSELKESRELLEKLSGKRVTAFRMPRLAQVSPDELIAAGYLADASLNPVWLPGRYRNLDKPAVPHRLPNGLVEVPVSVSAFGRIPLFWLSFKNLPEGVYRRLAWGSLRKHGFFSLYTHPWEYNETAAEKRWNLPGYVRRHAGKEMADRLEGLIEFFQRGGARFTTFTPLIGE